MSDKTSDTPENTPATDNEPAAQGAAPAGDAPDNKPGLVFDFNKVRIVGVKMFGPVDEALHGAAINELTLLVDKALKDNPALVPVNIYEEEGAADLISGQFNARAGRLPNGQMGLFVTLYEATDEDRAEIARVRDILAEQQKQEMLAQVARQVEAMKSGPAP